MLHPALRHLLRLQFRATLRRTGRWMRTPKGIAFGLIGVIVAILWFISILFSALIGRGTNPEYVRVLAPVALALMCLLNLVGGGGDKALTFTPAEINFLFPGPFTRRELLAYRLAKTILGTLGGALFMSLILLPQAGSYIGALAGAFLGILFVNLLTLAVVLTGQVVGERVYTRGRRIVLALLAAALVVAVGPVLPSLGDVGLTEIMKTVQESKVARVLLAPFAVFTRVFTSRSIGSELLIWSAIATAINAVLLALIVRLDANYLEAAAAASQRTFERVQRMRGERRLSSAAAGRAARGRLPMLPWLGGAGPTAWRQLTTAYRTARSTLIVVLLVCVGVVWMTAMGKGHLGAFVSGGLWATIFLGTVLKFDFRADLDQFAWLKAQPVRPWATAAGQLVVPVLLLVVVHVVLLASAAYVAKPEHRVWVFAALLFVVPFNVMLLGIENAIFLLFPTRTLGAAAGDLGQVGRHIVFFLLKILLVTAACGLSAGLGVAAAATGGKLMGLSAAGGGMPWQAAAVGVAVALLMLTLIAAATIPAVGWAYQKFDPSADTPA